jgi:hypothetical protein
MSGSSRYGRFAFDEQLPLSCGTFTIKGWSLQRCAVPVLKGFSICFLLKLELGPEE